MQATRYQVLAVDLELNDPHLSDIEDGAIGAELTPGSEPTFNEELGALVGTATLDIDLYADDESDRAPAEMVGDSDLQLGDIAVDFRIILPEDRDSIEEHLETWQEDGYHELDSDFRFHLESGIGTEIMNPLSDLIDDSFRGLLPYTRFTPEADAEDVESGSPDNSE
ncbi:hypothetical protein ACFQL1_09005 [Halomicroarcula sp. GCM10025709]|uniref:hypothetical protein n=1 Tax=Haloarcula TaxID=2237 RepID=UPI0024C34C6D|nr:hypothetical protein [Halomicroarcula sp. YJ-61-S]